MCGIVGTASTTGRGADEGILHSMCEAIAHRGPDGEGHYLSSPADLGGPGQTSIGLGMRRLAVVDLATGQQPIHNEDKTVWLVLNGEIYNYPELRPELERKGHVFYTNSDTEAIVHAYEEYGLDLPKHLDGMFALALWDERLKRLVIARDRLGKKPLLYVQNGPNLIFASEFQALLRHPDVSRETDDSAIYHYLSTMCVPAPMTAFAHIRKLEPGHMLVWQDGKVDIQRYWSLDFKTKTKISEEEACEEAVRLLKEAVRVRLMADVPLGAFLSGGIDSSAVVALMCQLSDQKVKTFSIGFDEREFNEISHARRIAERFGTEHHEFFVRPNAVEVLPMLVRHYGEPYADSSSIPTYYLSRMTREHVTVALNGDGGDECFAGYERYAAMRLSEHYHRLPAGLRHHVLDPAIAAIPQSHVTRSRMGKARRFLGVMPYPRAERYARWTSVINEEMKAELCTPEFLRRARPANPLASSEQWFTGNGELEIVDRALSADTAAYLPDDLLVKVDIASMAASLEARSPFLDHHVVEFAASLPASYKLKGMTTKHLLKKGLKGILPEQNLTRNKMGFGVPIGQWLRGELRGMFTETVLSDRALKRGYFRRDALFQMAERHWNGQRDYSHQLWTLMMLELWHREVIEQY